MFLVERALEAGKPVVTANKALLATHGDRLFQMAATAGGLGIGRWRGIPSFASREAWPRTTRSRHSERNVQRPHDDPRVFQVAEVIAEASASATRRAPRWMWTIDAAQKLSILALLGSDAIPFDTIPTTGLRS